MVSPTNPLVGSTANDFVGSSITALRNGNYVVGSSNRDNGAATNAGAATFGSGTTGFFRDPAGSVRTAEWWAEDTRCLSTSH